MKNFLGPVMNDGEWHHALLTRDFVDYEIELWLDGSRVDVRSMTGTPADNALEPGDPSFPDPIAVGVLREFNVQTVTGHFDGEIDEFAYWDRALTPDEVRNLAGCHRDIGPRVLNLTADRFTSPVGADHELCVYLEAGTHELNIVDPNTLADAQFSGWSPGPTSAWGTVFSVAPEIDAPFVFGLPVSAPTAQDAYDGTTNKNVQLVLTQPQHVYFSIVDDTALDNRGGVSIMVPEPGFANGLFVSVVVSAALAGRRATCDKRGPAARRVG